MSHMKNRDSNKRRREDRHAQAKVRKELASKRTPEEQVARLNADRFHASKERAKLAARIAARAEQPVEKSARKKKVA